MELICFHCKEVFERSKSEANKAEKHFCSVKCVQESNYLQDEFSHFRYFLKEINKRVRVNIKNNRPMEMNLTLQDLKDQWDLQNGKCSYTGIEMSLPRVIRYREFSTMGASVDRINSDVGYVKGNIEFVCLFVNYGKNKFTKEQTIEFLNKIKNI